MSFWVDLDIQEFLARYYMPCGFMIPASVRLVSWLLLTALMMNIYDIISNEAILWCVVADVV